MAKVIIHFANGLQDIIPVPDYTSAMSYCREHISYSGGKIRRVEIETETNSFRAVWDIEWNPLSQAKGLCS